MKSLSILTKEAVAHKNIVDGNFDGTLAQIQNLLGTNDGGVAGLFFAGKEKEWVEMTKEERINLMQQYISTEMSYLFEEI